MLLKQVCAISAVPMALCTGLISEGLQRVQVREQVQSLCVKGLKEECQKT